MMLVAYKLGESKIHGTGIFADEDIPKGNVIWKWDDRTDIEISEKDYNSLPVDEKEKIEHFGYISKLTGKRCYSADDMHYINHSEDSNTTEVIEPGKGGGTLVAKRDIHKGEELTQDYREFETAASVRARGIDLD